MWDKCLISLFVAIFHGFAGFSCNICKVKIGAIGKTHEFLFAVWIIKHEINGALGVVGAVFCWNFVLVDVFRFKSGDIGQEIMLKGAHFFKVFFPSVGFDKIFDFHLIAFAVAENEVAWADFISERFSLLSDTKWKIWVNGVDDIFVVRKNTLSCLWAEVSFVFIGELCVIIW